MIGPSVPGTPTLLRALNGLTPHFCGNMLSGQAKALLDARGNLKVRLAGYSGQSLLLQADEQNGAPTRR